MRATLSLLFSLLFHVLVFSIITYDFRPSIIVKTEQVPIKVYIIEVPKQLTVKKGIGKQQIKKLPKAIEKTKPITGTELITKTFKHLSLEKLNGITYNKATVLQRVIPEYPLLAKQNSWEGRVIIRVYISAEGICDSATIAQSSGHDILDNAALQSVYHWRFKPAQKERSNITDTLLVPFIFDLVR